MPVRVRHHVLMNSAESQFHGLSRKKIAELKRKAEKKEKNKAYYEKNRENLIEKVKEKRRQSREAVRSWLFVQIFL